MGNAQKTPVLSQKAEEASVKSIDNENNGINKNNEDNDENIIIKRKKSIKKKKVTDEDDSEILNNNNNGDADCLNMDSSNSTKRKTKMKRKKSKKKILNDDSIDDASSLVAVGLKEEKINQKTLKKATTIIKDTTPSPPRSPSIIIKRDIVVDDKIKLKNEDCFGTVKFASYIREFYEFGNDIWYGIDLDTQWNRNFISGSTSSESEEEKYFKFTPDGNYGGMQLFTCKPNCGLLVRHGYLLHSSLCDLTYNSIIVFIRFLVKLKRRTILKRDHLKYYMYLKDKNTLKTDEFVLQKGSNLSSKHEIMELFSKYDDPFDFIRSIFFWQINNIQYNPSLQWDITSRITEILKIRSVGAYNYANLFHYFMTAKGIESKIVVGYNRSAVTIAMGIQQVNHAWNIVFFNNRWHLIDLCFCTGFYDNELSWAQKLSNDYFLLDPYQFIYEHLPVENFKIGKKGINHIDYDVDYEMQMIKSPLTFDSWNSNICPSRAFFHNRIRLNPHLYHMVTRDGYCKIFTRSIVPVLYTIQYSAKQNQENYLSNVSGRRTASKLSNQTLSNTTYQAFDEYSGVIVFHPQSDNVFNLSIYVSNYDKPEETELLTHYVVDNVDSNPDKLVKPCFPATTIELQRLNLKLYNMNGLLVANKYGIVTAELELRTQKNANKILGISHDEGDEDSEVLRFLPIVEPKSAATVQTKRDDHLRKIFFELKVNQDCELSIMGGTGHNLQLLCTYEVSTGNSTCMDDDFASSLKTATFRKANAVSFDSPKKKKKRKSVIKKKT